MIAIRPEEPGDIPAIAGVNRTAFGGEVEVKLVEVIRASPGFIPGLSFVAVTEGRVVGHILFSPITIGAGSSGVPALALAPIAVLPEYQGRGIGSRLVEEGLGRCRELAHAIVIVVGWPSFYPRFGFTRARAKGLEAPFPVPDEAFMVLELVPGALAGVSGMVCFPPVLCP
jgi:putative acetyltransferase